MKAELTTFLGYLLKKLGYQLATGELGANISKDQKPGADFATFKAENWNWAAKFSDAPPEVVIEIDVQAELENQTEMEYVRHPENQGLSQIRS